MKGSKISNEKYSCTATNRAETAPMQGSILSAEGLQVIQRSIFALRQLFETKVQYILDSNVNESYKKWSLLKKVVQ